MKHELETEDDIRKLSENWDKETGDAPRLIKRIEDLPDLEEVSGANIGWVVEGIIAEGAVHMITSEPGGGKSTLAAAVGYAISHGLPFIDRATKQRPVLLLDFENPLPAIRERFSRLRIRTHQNLRA